MASPRKLRAVIGLDSTSIQIVDVNSGEILAGVRQATVQFGANGELPVLCLDIVGFEISVATNSAGQVPTAPALEVPLTDEQISKLHNQVLVDDRANPAALWPKTHD